MSKVWKWIIGILIVLVIVAVVVGGVVMVRNRAFMTSRVRPMTYATGQTRPNVQGTPNAPGAPNAQGTPQVPNTAPNGQRGPMMPYGYNGQRSPMMPYGFTNRNSPMGGWGNRGPMMGKGGSSHFGRFMPFGIFGMGILFLGGIVGLVIPLVILALVAFIFYQLGKRAGLNSAKNQTPAPSEPAPVDTQGRGRKVAKS
jgi:flagellar basal body-associated protein FliL